MLTRKATIKEETIDSLLEKLKKKGQKVKVIEE